MPEPKQADPTDILTVLMDMRNGQVASDINGKFNELVQSVLETTGKGELTIKLFIKPGKLAMGGAVIEVQTSHECKMKKPELAIGESTFFVTKEGKLTREDPNQTAMFDREEVKERSNGRRTN